MSKLSFRLAVTQAHIDRYGSVNGDHEALHYDAAHARACGFRGPIAHGTMLLAPLVDLALHRFGEQFLSSGSLEVRWVAPVCAGEVQFATLDEAGAIEAVNDALPDRPFTLLGTAKCQRTEP